MERKNNGILPSEVVGLHPVFSLTSTLKFDGVQMNRFPLTIYSSVLKSGVSAKSGKEYAFYETQCMAQTDPNRAPAVGKTAFREQYAPGAYTAIHVTRVDKFTNIVTDIGDVQPVVEA